MSFQISFCQSGVFIGRLRGEDGGVEERINPHEVKENIHLRPTSISRTLFRFFSFSGTSVGLSKSRDTGAAQKKELVCPIQRGTMLTCTIGAAICTTYSPFYHNMFNNVHHSNCSLFVLFQTGHVSIFHNFLNLLVGVFLHVFAALAALGCSECILGCSGKGREPPWSLLPFGIRIPL